MTLSADLIVYNGKLLTQSGVRPRASAMAVRGGRIAFVGDDAPALALRGPDTRVVDLDARTVVPGFCDCHLHLMWFGEQLLRQADLVGVRDADELLARLSDLAARSPGNGWLRGHGFDQSKMSEGRFLTRRELDRVSRDRPIIVTRVCGHAAVANSAAIALLDDEARAAGDAESGLYTEEAVATFHRRIPPMGDDEAERAAMLAMDVALNAGITSVQTMFDVPEQMRAFARLRRKGKLKIRITAMPRWECAEALYRHGVDTAFGDEWLRFGAVKLFSDGSLGAQTALLAEPYADAPHTSGVRMYDPTELKRRATAAQRMGFQVAIHAIGDQAVRETLDAIEFALDADPQRCGNEFHRHRIEHVAVCPPELLDRLAKRKIVATLQPQFVTSDTWTPQRLGPQRARHAYPFATLMRAGVPVGLSSDCPVERLSAFECLASAVGRHEWSTHDALTIDEALFAYTVGSAYCGHAEDRQGSLEVGKLADFVVLSADPATLLPSELRGLRAEQVYVGGKLAAGCAE